MRWLDSIVYLDFKNTQWDLRRHLLLSRGVLPSKMSAKWWLGCHLTPLSGIILWLWIPGKIWQSAEWCPTPCFSNSPFTSRGRNFLVSQCGNAQKTKDEHRFAFIWKFCSLHCLLCRHTFSSSYPTVSSVFFSACSSIKKRGEPPLKLSNSLNRKTVWTALSGGGGLSPSTF